MRPHHLVLLSLVFFAFSCSSSKQNQTDTTSEKEMQIAPPELRVPPSHCRIAGTIEVIDEKRYGTTEKDPCSSAPCMATVRIDSILGYGSAFGETLAAGQQITVKFVLSLAPSTDANLPGLAKGSSFVANVRRADQIQGGKVLSVGTYELR